MIKVNLSIRTIITLSVVTLSLLAFTTACSISTTTPAPMPTETPLPVDAFSINQKLGRGINLGNALDAPAEGAWGVTLQEEYFDLIADRGFDSVRIPIRWSAHAQKSAPYAIDPEFIARVDWAVENALARGLTVVINFHHYDEIFLDPAGHEERFLAMWAQVAEHYQEAPPEVVFEILNEPHAALTPTLWNKLLVKALAVIRETNPDRMVMLGPGEWNNVHALKYLQLPENDRNLIVTVHYYEPFHFTHQGAEWAEGADAWLGTTWEATDSQQLALERDFGIAADWGLKYERPIYVGEFGAYSKADMPSRTLWTQHVSRSAEARGFSWSYWEFCAGFGIYDPAAQTWNEALVEALVPGE